jgi:S-adenosylmethionine hydrolase
MSPNRKPPLVTLLTDFGAADTYVGVMKAVILGICPQARIVDLCHEVPAQDVQQAAFLLDTAWRYCSEGTVHLVVVDPGVGGSRRALAVEAHGQRFVAPDNGVLTYVVAQAKQLRAIAIESEEHFLPSVSRTFHGRDVLAPVVARLACGAPIEQFGPPIEDQLVQFPISRPAVKGSRVEAHVVHVDRFGNLITDLREDDLAAWGGKGRASRITIRVGQGSIEGISLTYSEAKPGELLALFGSSGRLEIAVNEGSAAGALRVGRGEAVLLESDE